MNKLVCLFTLVLTCLTAALPASAQEGSRVAVMPVQMSAEGAKLEMMDRLSKGLSGVLMAGLADQGLMAIALGDNFLSLGDEMARAQAREMGAEYLLNCRAMKVGDRFNLTGQLLALTPEGQSSQRHMVTANAPSLLPQAAEELVQLVTDHLFGGGAQVVSVTVSGNTMLDSQAILNALRLRPGGTYSDAKATSDLKRIYAMGYFDDVQVEAQDVSGGKSVHFTLIERSQLGSIVFRGNKKADQEELLKAANIKVNDIPSERDIAASVDSIKDLYIKKGFSNVHIMTSLETDGDGRGTLVYDISEGGKIYIKEIVFDGNEFYSDWTLSRKIETSSRNFLISWLSGSGKLNQEKLSGDSHKLESFYHNSGFLQAQVGDPITSGGEDGGLTITFPIVEGPRFRVGEVTIGGDMLEDDKPELLLKHMEIRDLKWFSREVMQEDVKALQNYYSDRGYAHNTVEPRITGPFEDDKLNLEFYVQPNQKVYFDRITIVGNDKTRDKVIRRQLSFAEGDQYSATRIQNSQASLMRSTYFEQVNLVPGPSDSDDKMNLRVEVKEKPTGSFQIGGGYSSYNSIFGVIRLTQDNLFGYGRRVSVEANVGSKNSLFDISFTDPWVFDIPLTMGVDLFKYTNKFDFYTKDATGISLRAGYPVWNNFYLTGQYTFQDITIKDVAASSAESIKDMMNYSRDSVFTVSLRRDTRNHFFFPNRGNVARFSYAKATELFSGDTNFSRYEAEVAQWFPFPFYKGASFMLHGEMGYMKEDADGGLPVYEKYMIGGINSVRGYDWYSISPKDPLTGETLGGEKMLTLNAEIAFPVFMDEGLYGVVFYDMGQVWDKDANYNFGDMRRSYGGGLRYLSPMGPIRIEYGRPLDREPGDSSGQWEFTMGSMF